MSELREGPSSRSRYVLPDGQQLLFPLPGPRGPFQETLRVLSKAAPTRCTILLEGPSGGGKTWSALLAHEISPWRSGPFVEVSCPLLSDELSESELFGHEKGAFTGAHERKLGKMDVARGGTLFLEEIGDASPRLQAKLLRVLDTLRYERVGGLETLTAEARFIAATNRNLAELVRQGKFREDLYHRLNVISIRVPALAERLDEIPGLVEGALRELAAKYERAVPRLEEGLLEVLGSYSWPGNVRELRNTLEQMLVLGEDEVLGLRDLPPGILKALETPARSRPWKRKGEPPTSLEVKQVLERSGGNRTRASQRLGISRQCLHRLLAKYRIQ